MRALLPALHVREGINVSDTEIFARLELVLDEVRKNDANPTS